jgi:hypothetical protein
MRTNLILLGVLVALGAVWLLGRDREESRNAAPVPRLFPDFNKEAADLIVIEGGWKDSAWTFGRRGSSWFLVTAGEYPVKSEAADKLLDAVYNLRKENLVGTSAELRASTRTGEKGRLVRVLKGPEPMAEFRVGKSPEGSYDVVFIRPEGSDEIYRTRTILSEEQRGGDQPWDQSGRARGFSWDNYVQNLRKWVDTQIWSLGDLEQEAIWLERPEDELTVRLLKKGQDEWERSNPLIEEAPAVPADADAARDIVSRLRYLSFEEVVGTVEESAAEYGLDEPKISVVLQLKKKVEKEQPAEGEEPAEGTGEGAEPAEPEWIDLTRTVEVGNKVSRPSYWDDEKGEASTRDYYAIRVGGKFDDAEEEKRSRYIFLVSDYTIGALKKTAEELRAAPTEEEAAPPEEGAQPEEATPPDDAQPDESAQKPEEATPPEEPADTEEPAKSDEPAGDG